MVIDDSAFFEHKRAMDEHREKYPEQYTHALVGKFVRAPDGTTGNVTRVIRSRFGALAILEDNAKRAWLVEELTELPRA